MKPGFFVLPKAKLRFGEVSESDVVLGAEERKPLALELVQLLDRVELALVERKVLLEDRETRGDVADLSLERLDSLGDRGDLAP